MKPLDLKTIQRFINTARGLYEREGEVEIDDTPETLAVAKQLISPVEYTLDAVREEGGMYVKAWVWVPIEEVE